MKQFFLFGLIIVIPLAIVAALLYSVGRFLVSVVNQWRENRVLDEISRQSEAKRRQEKGAEGPQPSDGGAVPP
jgi:uncharacterized membrane protein